MMSKGKRDDKFSESGTINLIGNGTVIKGEIHSNGDIRNDGTIKGTVESKSKVVIGAKGLIDGILKGKNADISGTAKGKMIIQDTLYLKANSVLTGDIVTNKLVVESGANFNGNCSMGSEAQKEFGTDGAEIKQNGKLNGQARREEARQAVA